MKDASHPDGTIAKNQFVTVAKPVIIYGSNGLSALSTMTCTVQKVMRQAP